MKKKNYFIFFLIVLVIIIGGCNSNTQVVDSTTIDSGSGNIGETEEQEESAEPLSLCNLISIEDVESVCGEGYEKIRSECSSGRSQGITYQYIDSPVYFIALDMYGDLNREDVLYSFRFDELEWESIAGIGDEAYIKINEESGKALGYWLMFRKGESTWFGITSFHAGVYCGDREDVERLATILLERYEERG